jgi:hypothetical protein
MLLEAIDHAESRAYGGSSKARLSRGLATWHLAGRANCTISQTSSALMGAHRCREPIRYEHLAVPATLATHHGPAAMSPTVKSGAAMRETAMAKLTVIEVVKTIVMKAVRSAGPIYEEDRAEERRAPPIGPIVGIRIGIRITLSRQVRRCRSVFLNDLPASVRLLAYLPDQLLIAAVDRHRSGEFATVSLLLHRGGAWMGWDQSRTDKRCRQTERPAHGGLPAPLFS